MKYHSIIVLLLLGFVVGCGSGQVPLSGTVVFSDDGSPLTIGNVVLSTPTFRANGPLNDKGCFTVGSYSDKDGLPPGTYKVGVVGAEIPLGAEGMSTYSLIDPKMGSPSSSGIEITVDKNTKTLDIKVDRNPTPRPTVR